MPNHITMPSGRYITGHLSRHLKAKLFRLMRQLREDVKPYYLTGLEWTTTDEAALVDPDDLPPVPFASGRRTLTIEIHMLEKLPQATRRRKGR